MDSAVRHGAAFFHAIPSKLLLARAAILPPQNASIRAIATCADSSPSATPLPPQCSRELLVRKLSPRLYCSTAQSIPILQSSNIHATAFFSIPPSPASLRCRHWTAVAHHARNTYSIPDSTAHLLARKRKLNERYESDAPSPARQHARLVVAENLRFQASSSHSINGWRGVG